MRITSDPVDPGNGVRVASLKAADGRSWLAMQAAGLTATFSLAGLLQATVTGVGLEINSAAPQTPVPTPALDWTTAVGVGDAGTGEFSPAEVEVGGTVIGFTGGRTFVDGEITTLDLLGLVSGTAHFELERKAVKASPAGTEIDAALLTIALTNVQLDVGAAGFGVRITTSGVDAGVRIASLSPVAAVAARRAGWRSRPTGSARSWTPRAC